MSGQPLVSIVTPSYNQGQFLEAAIQSVLDQDYPNIEYLVIDGGSQDQSVAILNRYTDRLAYWVSEPDRGQAHAINKGLQRARGSILGWLNSDDVLLPGAVQRAVELMAAHPEIDAIYGRLERIDEQGRPVPTPVLPKDRVDFGASTAIGECVVNQPGTFWRRAIMEKTGYLDESLHYAMDYEYWVRMLLAGARFYHLAEPLASFRLSPGSKTVGSTATAAEEHLRLIDRLAASPETATRLGLRPEDVGRQARRGRSVVSMYAFYGSLKHRRWAQAWRWLLRANRADPAVMFQRRWLDLAFGGLARRLR